MMRHIALYGSLVAWCATGAATSVGVAQRQSEPALSIMVGKPAPDFTVRTIDGRFVSLKEYKGKVVLVNFWATWCGTCLTEMPWLAQLREKYAARGFEVLGILTNEAEPARLQSLLTKNQVRYPILKCNHTTAQAYGGIPVLPESFYIDRQGVIVATADEAKSQVEIETRIRTMLDAPKRDGM